ncbi:hypothetical protein LIA77_11125 [Sarocladium implicatum]|nr:hypothetical protein LIA77_11125 [Sarocladium implicatum]
MAGHFLLMVARNPLLQSLLVQAKQEMCSRRSAESFWSHSYSTWFTPLALIAVSCHSSRVPCDVPVCDVTCGTTRELQRHKRELHGQVRFYCCYPECSSVASRDGMPRRANVVRHIMKRHEVNDTDRYVERVLIGLRTAFRCFQSSLGHDSPKSVPRPARSVYDISSAVDKLHSRDRD